jgi:CRISPR-associated RAMP protein (TIGR02581 family)
VENNTYYNKYYFKGSIRLLSALHIGGGRVNELNTDNPVVRTSAGIPFIPGSSLKGVFRSFVDTIVPGIGGITTCQLNEEYKGCYSVGDGLTKWKDENNRKFTENQLAVVLEDHLCDVCKTFGSPWKASKVFFTDSYLSEKSGITQVRDGVVIDRDSETSVKNLKYDFEVVPVDSVFSFSLSLDNATPVDLGIIALGLNEMRSGFMQIGGNTSRGTGNFILEDLKVYETILNDTEQLKKYVRNIDIEKKMNSLDSDSFLEEKINHLFPQEGE